MIEKIYNTNVILVDTSMTRKPGIRITESSPELLSKIFRKTGYARFVAPAKTNSNRYKGA